MPVAGVSVDTDNWKTLSFHVALFSLDCPFKRYQIDFKFFSVSILPCINYNYAILQTSKTTVNT